VLHKQLRIADGALAHLPSRQEDEPQRVTTEDCRLLGVGGEAEGALCPGDGIVQRAAELLPSIGQ
jgi:hypothetical protein